MPQRNKTEGLGTMASLLMSRDFRFDFNLREEHMIKVLKSVNNNENMRNMQLKNQHQLCMTKLESQHLHKTLFTVILIMVKGGKVIGVGITPACN